MGAPAAIYVVRGEDIRRTGVRTLAEALAMVPGLQVARLTSNLWAVASRGFADITANKLLVLIDGRTVYTPSFAGVWWDVQDVMLEDVDRIEVIRGPGGTLWGANAVNGVVNVVTRSAAQTTGLLATAGGGTTDRGFAAVRQGAAAVADPSRPRLRQGVRLGHARAGGRSLLAGARRVPRRLAAPPGRHADRAGRRLHRRRTVHAALADADAAVFGGGAGRGQGVGRQRAGTLHPRRWARRPSCRCRRTTTSPGARASCTASAGTPPTSSSSTASRCWTATTWSGAWSTASATTTSTTRSPSASTPPAARSSWPACSSRTR